MVKFDRFFARVREDDRDCNIEPASVTLRHHAAGSPLPRREQWAPARTIVGELDTQTRN